MKTSIPKNIQPVTERLHDKRLKRAVGDMVIGILGGETPVITEIVWQHGKDDGESWAVTICTWEV
jgi:hypothetical protein